MRVLKVMAEGLTTSFRYPHFIQQVHPSFPLPPPATIYGHVAGALGYWFDPTGVQFAYHFVYAAKVRDIEHTIILKPVGGKLESTSIPRALEGNVNPFYREIFFFPRLTLYLNRPEWEAAFRSPRYAVQLGRSQDLFTYSSVQVVDLQQASNAYFEHALLSHSFGRHTSQGFAVTMPRYLDYARNRYPHFATYFAVEERVDSSQFLWFGEAPAGEYWVDPATPQIRGAHRGVHFLSFVD